MTRNLNVLLLSCLLFIIYGGYAQDYIYKAEFQQYSDALYAQKLVRNNNEVVPLQRLDTLVLATWFGSSKYTSVFRDATDMYLPGRHLDSVSEDLGATNVVILGLDHDHQMPVSRFRDIAANAILIAVVFDRSVYQTLPLDAADVVVHAFNPDTLSSHITIQQIFGGSPYGVFSVPLPDIQRLGFAPASAVGMNAPHLQKNIDSIAQMAIDSGAAPGIQVMAIRRGKVVFHKAYGHHTYAKQRPVQLTDLYDLASISKVTSGLPVIMRMVGDGTFDLDATLAEYVPEFASTDKAQMRWRDILAHNARLMPWIPYWRNTVKKNGKFRGKTFKSRASKNYPVTVTDQLYLHKGYRQKMFDAIKKSPLNEQPGFVYSGLSFYLMPGMIESMTGLPFERLIKTDIYQPLGAYSITYNPLRFYSAEEIIPTERDTFFRMTQLHGRVHDEGAAMMGGVSCNAGLFATTIDLAKMAQMYLNKGTYGDVEVIPAQVVDEFTRCQFCALGNHRGLGFDKPGLDVESIAASTTYCAEVSPESFGHSGYTGTLMWIDPKEDLIFIFMSNRVYPTRLNRKLYTLKVRPAIHQVLYDAIN